MSRVGPLVIGDQPLPHTPEMEQAVLACIMQDTVCAANAIETLPDDAFYVPANRRLFWGLKETYKTGMIDIVRVGEVLERHNFLDDIGGMDFVRNVYSAIPTIVNYDKYVLSVRENLLRRNLIASCYNLVGDCYEQSSDVEEALNKAQQIINAPVSIVDEPDVPISDITSKTIERMGKVYDGDPDVIGVSTGFQRINDIIWGLRPGEVIVIAARPSIGKTALALNMMVNIAHYGYHAYFISKEMDSVLLMERILYAAARVDKRALIERRADWHEFEQEFIRAKAKIDSLNLHFDDSREGCWEDHRHKLRKACHKHPIKVAFLDYLQLMHLRKRGNMPREEEVARISSDAKTLARDLGIPLVIMAQLNRIAEDHRPNLANLRESGAVEQDADIVALLHRKRPTADREMAELSHQGKPLPTDVCIGKNRNGPTGIARLLFHERFTLFEDEDRIADEDVPV